MSNNSDIDIFKALDWLRDNAINMAQAKANRVMLEEMRKSKKAILMRQAEQDGVKTVAAQEVQAYAHPDYMALLEGLKVAVEEEERLRWLMVAAQLKCEVWRSLESSKRVEAKNL